MRNIILTLVTASAFSFFGETLFADTWVRGYTRKDGTYVQPHYRSDRNNSPYDNYSTKGNINPYTGKKGTKDPDKSYGGYGSQSNHQYDYNPYDD